MLKRIPKLLLLAALLAAFVASSAPAFGNSGLWYQKGAVKFCVFSFHETSCTAGSNGQFCHTEVCKSALWCSFSRCAP
jgi:hypothetical protein